MRRGMVSATLILAMILSLSLGITGPTAPVAAANVTLSGRITDQLNTAQSGATVAILTAGTSTVIISTTTDNDDTYNVQLALRAIDPVS